MRTLGYHHYQTNTSECGKLEPLLWSFHDQRNRIPRCQLFLSNAVIWYSRRINLLSAVMSEGVSNHTDDTITLGFIARLGYMFQFPLSLFFRKTRFILASTLLSPSTDSDRSDHRSRQHKRITLILSERFSVSITCMESSLC